MKTIAFFLPQFHTVPENDAWWGKGYTEWTAVKKAKPLYQGHNQPKIPYGEKYYNLLEKDTMEWQAGLMRDFGVDALCFYHYYFSNGKKILEKPAENLLVWKDIHMPFCFSWANETWARTWSALPGKNVWNSLEEENSKEKTKQDGILLKQEYGNERDWHIHFDYLLPFFKDSRYIKHNNAPIFIIHRADMIPCLPQMMDLWNVLAKENGFDGIYFIGSNTFIRGLDGYIRQEANYSDHYNQLRVDYSRISEEIIRNALSADEKTYLCAFPAYDDTPRRGEKGKIIEGSTPEKFYEQIKQLYAISMNRNLEYIFINAWNEWGEGMYLEPDKVNGYRYLEAVKRAKEDGKKQITTDMNAWKPMDCSLVRRLQSELAKIRENARMISRIAVMKHLQENMRKYFDSKHIQTFAIYGMGDVAKVFLANLPDGVLQYVVDKNYYRITSEYPVYGVEEKLPDVDLIVVCLSLYFIVAYKDLKKVSKARVISLDQFLDEIEVCNKI